MTASVIPETGNRMVQPSRVPGVTSRGTRPRVFETAWNGLRIDMVYYISVCDGRYYTGFLVEDGRVTDRIDHAGQWNSFEDADRFAKSQRCKKYLIFVPAEK